MYEWIERNNDQASPRHLILLNDALSAFLLTFEAALQHAKDQYHSRGFQPPFDRWLAQQPENAPLLKGIRTLRHLDGHVQSYPVAGHITVFLGGVPGGQNFNRRWSLQELQLADLRRLTRPQLRTSQDLATWNGLVQSGNSLGLLGDALARLNGLMLRLEALV
jgi:hypothetical protein